MTLIDGHELAVVSTLVGCGTLMNRTLPKGWIRSFIHRQPVPALATFWAMIGITLPLVVPPIRRALNLPTHHYDAEHPKTVFPKYD
jgi:hypothetical protein